MRFIKYTLAILLLAALPSFGAIARTGSCAATATSCTLSAVSAGDLVVSFAYRSGSTTAPSADASNTTIATAATANGGTTGSLRISCRKASSGSDTSSGTYTNASAVTAIAYSGTAVNATADCNTTGVGGTSTNNAKTSTTASYDAITMQDTSGNAWVAGWLGASASSHCVPTGMTAVASSGTGSSKDTNAVASSWSTQTCTVSSETWMSYVTEIKTPQTARRLMLMHVGQ